MSDQAAKLSDIERKYPGSYREAFETMVTHMFMQRLSLPEPPTRRAYQWGIEADPVDVPNDLDYFCKKGTYAYQAKYFDPGTEIADKKELFIKSIAAAKEAGATDLFFYVNKELRQNSQTGHKPAGEAEIEKAAENAGLRPIHWYTKKKIEDELDMPAYLHIKNLFLGEQNASNIPGFYEHVCKIITQEHANAVYGSMSLLDGYIEPILCKREGEQSLFSLCGNRHESKPSEAGLLQDVRDYLESWVTKNEYITIFCGEPGHGKTSLCQKAMYDFYNNNWLEKKVLNVFTFSANPAGTPVQDKKRFDSLIDLLSWGDIDSRVNQKVKKENCGNALIFLDGFDELLEWLPGYNMEEFLGTVLTFLKSFDDNGYIKPHIVITTRKMALPPRKKAYVLGIGNSAIRIPIYEMQLIPKIRQYEWIEKHGHKNIDNPEKYLARYKEMYERLAPQDEMKAILGIPIIFRMIVTQEILPKNGDNLSEIYEQLYDTTWERNRIRVRREYNKEYMKRKLMKHALRIYADDNNSAKTTDQLGMEEAAWLYQFYTRYDEVACCKKGGTVGYRIGFLHRTIYEHFLACEILSWFRNRDDADYNTKIFSTNWEEDDVDRTDSDFLDLLAVLGKRKLSMEVISSIRNLYERGQRNGGKEWVEDEAFERAYRILKRTDGILQLPGFYCDKYKTVNREKREFLRDLAVLLQKDSDSTPLVRAENVLCNVLSICSVCRHPVSAEKINIRVMQMYDLQGVRLDRANFRGVNLTDARLAKAILEEVDFCGTILERANLSGAVLAGDFTGCDLSRASMAESNLSRAILNGADMEGALLSQAVFAQDSADTDLSEVNLEGARISQAILSEEQEKITNGENVLGKPLRQQHVNVRLNPKQTVVKRAGEFIIEKYDDVEISNASERYRVPDFGRYKQGANGTVDALSWRVLKWEQNRVLVIAEKLIDCIPYNKTDKPVTWEKSYLREWMNEDFLYGAFDKNERARIIRVHNQNPENPLYGTKGGRSTWDRVFALSIEEARYYFDTDSDRRAVVTPNIIAKPPAPCIWWWLRSPGDFSNRASLVDTLGKVSCSGHFVHFCGVCVRPALWLHL